MDVRLCPTIELELDDEKIELLDNEAELDADEVVLADAEVELDDVELEDVEDNGGVVVFLIGILEANPME